MCGNRSLKPTKYNLIKSISALSLTEIFPLNTALYVKDNSNFTSKVVVDCVFFGSLDFTKP